MHCGMCGFERPGQSETCPRCGHAISFSEDAPKPRVPLSLSREATRAIVYLLILFGLARVGGAFYDRWLTEEGSRLDAGLLGQTLERRRTAQVAALEQAAAEEAGR